MHWMLMPLRRYAEFSGRSRRMEYWMFFLFTILVNIGFSLLSMLVGGTALMVSGTDPSALAGAGGAVLIVFVLEILFFLAILIPSIAVGVRRLHDTNRTGWWLLAPIIPYTVGLVSLFTAVSSPDQAAGPGILGAVGGILGLVLGITVLVFMFLDGTRGPNKYGPDPKAPLDTEVFA